MTTSATHPLEPKVCTDCGRPMWSKHMEVCTGRTSAVTLDSERGRKDHGADDGTQGSVAVGSLVPASPTGSPRLRSDTSDCGCPNGWKHLSDCELVTGRRPAGVSE